MRINRGEVMEFPEPPKTFGKMRCTVDSRRALTTVTIVALSEVTVVAVCICGHTAVSGSAEGCRRILNRKHRKVK